MYKSLDEFADALFRVFDIKVEREDQNVTQNYYVQAEENRKKLQSF